MLNLKVISPEKIVLEAECRSVTLPASDGQITVYSNHAPLYTLIAPGEVVARTEKGEISLGVGSGFANITSSGVTLLANFGVLTDEIDAVRAQDAKARAEELIKNRKSEQDLALASAELSRSLVELKLASKRRN
ncbi:MAG: ATP synthase F1 subunit epsilon [Chloroflexota bacterium]|jgi:F-type H+-transporting ATPase subunit epsilon|nr:ATP synthase F1 subunit epsilon [Chloroflexota bacterium]